LQLFTVYLLPHLQQLRLTFSLLQEAAEVLINKVLVARVDIGLLLVLRAAAVQQNQP
jgi:hypothetical protein